MGFLSIGRIIKNKVGSLLGGLFHSEMTNEPDIKSTITPTLIIHGKKV